MNPTLTLSPTENELDPLKRALDVRRGYRYLVDLVFCMHGLALLEREIGHLMLQGLLYQQIAQQLFLSESTIKAYAQHIFEKMHLKNRRIFEQYVHALIASL